MRKPFLLLNFAVILAVFILTNTMALPAVQSTIIGRATQIWINQGTRVDDRSLDAGHYQIWHETRSGSEHVLLLHRVGDPDVALQNSDQAFVGEPVVVSCKAEDLAVRATRTTVTIVPNGHGPRITRVEIKGERVALVFPDSTAQRF